MESETKTIIYFVVGLILLLLYKYNQINEGFWNYESKRMDIICKYGTQNPYNDICRNFNLLKYAKRQQIIDNPIGYVTNGKKVYPLLEVQIERYRYDYYIKKKYRIIKLFESKWKIQNEDDILVKGEGKFKIRLYDMYDPVRTNVYFERVGMLRAIDEINKKPKYLDLYLSRPHRHLFEYFATTKNGVNLTVYTENKNYMLNDGDIVNVDGYGKYEVVDESKDYFLT